MTDRHRPGSAALRRFLAPGELGAIRGQRLPLAAVLRARVELRTLDIRLLLGQAQEVDAAAGRLAGSFDADVAPALVGDCWGLQIEASLMRSDYPAMERLSRQCIDLHRRAGDRSGEASRLNGLGVALEDTGRKEQALELYRQALALFRALGDQGGIGNSLVNVATVLGGLGQDAEAERAFREAIRILGSCGNKGTQAFAYSNYSVLLCRQRRWDEAIAALARSRQIAERIGDRYGLAFSLANGAGILARRGSWGEAERAWRQAIALRRGIGERLYLSLDCLNLAALLQQQGLFAESAGLLHDAIALGRAVGEQWIATRGLLSLAEASGLQGDHAGMRRQLDEAVQADGDAAQVVWYQLLRAECALAQDRGDEAAAAIDGLAPRYGAMRPEHQCELHQLRARSAARRGAAAGTVDGDYGQALAIARGNGDPYLEAVALYHQGAWQRRSGAPWSATLDRAERLFSELGAGHWLEKVRALKDPARQERSPTTIG
ncbi:MAG TPA: tetratricopeptide repeat protein [Candidatus Edwardsbacteria bacterium]|nr:tetratricopeptide repeat protein [Candidatus Edwardsbacteria bacterium]